MTFPVGQWIDLDPEPVPIEDPRVRTACLVADGAWVRSASQLTVDRVRDVVRAVLAHVDDLAKISPPQEIAVSANVFDEIQESLKKLGYTGTTDKEKIALNGLILKLDIWKDPGFNE